MEIFSDMFLFMNVFTVVSILILTQNRPDLYTSLSFVLCLCGISLDYFSCWRRIFRYVWDDDVVSSDVGDKSTNSRWHWRIQDSQKGRHQPQGWWRQPNTLANFARKLLGSVTEDVASPEVGNKQTNNRRCGQLLKPAWVIYSLVVGLKLLAQVAQKRRKVW